MMQKSTKKMQVWKKILFGIISVLCIFALAYGLLLLYLTATEYKPVETEKLALAGEAAQKEISLGDSLKIMTWNVGYGALGDNADFFMQQDQNSVVLSTDDMDDLTTFVPGISAATMSYSTTSDVDGGQLDDSTTYTIAGVKSNYATMVRARLESIGRLIPEDYLRGTVEDYIRKIL